MHFGFEGGKCNGERKGGGAAMVEEQLCARVRTGCRGCDGGGTFFFFFLRFEEDDGE